LDTPQKAAPETTVVSEKAGLFVSPRNKTTEEEEGTYAEESVPDPPEENKGKQY
jgi:hypothetical protein